MEAIEIARRLSALNKSKEACRAYAVALHTGGLSPEEELGAASYILQHGEDYKDYKVSYTCFRDLYNRGCFKEECLAFMTGVFYEPNIKMLQTRYEKNCKLLEKYPYIFRRDFLPFEELPIKFYPFDDKSFIPFYPVEERFGDYVNFNHPQITHYFFKDLSKPILAKDIYSQYELEYLRDNVRRSEFVGKENHIYLHYTDWARFCAYLQCLNLRPLLKEEKIVFLFGDEISQYPIDFKERYGIDYTLCPVKPLGVREVNRLIWHTQLSTHNGGDFFNEIFDYHPNLLALTSIMMENMENVIAEWRKGLGAVKSSKEKEREFIAANKGRRSRVLRELCRMQDPTDKDIFVALYMSSPQITEPLEPDSRIVPAVFFQPHFYNIVYGLTVDKKNNTILSSDQYNTTATSPIFRGFKYIKTFTPMRRFTTSHGATVKFMYRSSLEAEKKREEEEKTEKEKKEEKVTVVADAVTQRVLNRSFMIDWQDRLYQDCVLVRYEDGKLNPKATFTALAEFLDLPYTESMTYCSENGEKDNAFEDKAIGFDLSPVYRTYDEYVNDSERKYIEYFLRDAYEYYGYDFQYYNGRPMTIEDIDALTDDFSTIDHYIRETWIKLYQQAKATIDDVEVDEATMEEIHKGLLEGQMRAFHENRRSNSRILMRGLRFLNRNSQPLHMMPRLKLDPALLERPLYH